MLQFVVLGQIPGTQFRITFSWLLLITLVAAIGMLVRLESPRLAKWWNERTKRSNLTTS